VETGTLRLRAFIEGVEVPCVSAICTAAISGKATATVQLVAADAALDLYPRSLVHVFFYDHSDVRAVSDLKQDEFDKEELKQVMDLEGYLADDKYKLLFAGELYTIQYTQTFSSRNIIIQCQDFSTYWASARALFVSGKSTSSKTKALAYSAGAVLRYDKSSRKPYEFILDLLLNKKSVQHPDAQGLMGGLLMILEYIGGVFDGDAKYRGLNDFFSQAELRLHLSRMTGTAKGDDTAKLLLGTKGFRKMFKRSLSSMGNTISFEDITGMVLSRLQSYVAPVLAPRYRRKTQLAYDVKKTTYETVDLNAAASDRLAQLEWIRSQASRPSAAMSAVIHTQDDETGTGGMEKLVTQYGVSAGDPLQGFEETHVFGKQAASFAAAADKALASSDNATVAGTAPITSELLNHPKLGVAAVLDHAAVMKAFSMSSVKEPSTRWPGFEYPGVTTGQHSTFKQLASKAIKAYKKGKIKASTVTETVTGSSTPWLYTHIVSPELFLCAPPKCNVLFPENISDVAFSREWSKEITRLHLTTRKEWAAQSSAFQKQQYISPAIPTADKVSALDQFEKGKSFVYPHEIFSGIIPKYDQVPKIPAYKKLAKGQAADVGDDYQLDKVDYLQRIANFLFIKYRIGPRAMQMSGKFNPRAVVGMPAMVLVNLPLDDDIRTVVNRDVPEVKVPKLGDDKVAFIDPQQVFDEYAKEHDKWVESREDTPTVTCGVMHSLMHTMTQEGGTTRYTVTHLWNPYKEEVPGMGNFEIKVPGKSRTVESKHEVSLAAMWLDGAKTTAAGAVSPYTQDTGGTAAVLEVGDLDKSVVTTTQNAASQLKGPYAKLMKEQVKASGAVKEKWKGPKGGDVTGVSFSNPSEIVVSVAKGDPAAGNGTWLVEKGTATITITEQYTPYKRKKLGEIPFEYAARPPWLGKVYTNSRIGSKFYLPLLGCTSICDEFKKLDYKLVVNAIRQLLVVPELYDPETGASVFEEPLIQSMVQDFATGHTLAAAADGLLRAYGQNKRLSRPGAVSQFLDTFTARPIATLNDVMGSKNLRYDDAGKVITGREGFHSRAFGLYTDFALLDHPKLKQHGDAGELRKLDPRTDPRKPRRLVAERYLEQLVQMSASATKTKKLG